MRVLVTGGAGFIGSYLCENLLSSGHEVRVLDLVTPSNPVPGVEYLRGDIRKERDMSFAVRGIDWVYHLAAVVSVPVCENDPQLCRSTNIDGTAVVLSSIYQEMQRRDTPIGFIFASSSAVYGKSSQQPIMEDSCGLQPPLSNYGLSKLQAEQLISVLHKTNKVPSWIFRLFNVYGRGQSSSPDRAGVVSVFANSLRQKRSLRLDGGGHHVRDFVSIYDVTSALVRVMSCSIEQGNAKPFNIGTGTAISIHDLAQKMIQYSHANVSLEIAPERQGDIPYSLADIKRAKTVLGWHPQVSLEDGIREVLGAAELQEPPLNRKGAFSLSSRALLQ